jgi:hypothetical protein
VCAAPEGPSKAEKRREAKLAKASKKLGVPVDALRRVGGHRALSRRKGDLAALIKTLHRKVDPRLLPLLTRVALKAGKDQVSRLAAVRLLSVYALEGDSTAYLALQKTFRALYKDKYQKVWEAAAAENHRLLLAFDLECEVNQLFEDTYRAKFYRKAQRAYNAILDFRHPSLRTGVALEALKEALHPRSRFGIKERQRAVRENGIRGAPLTPVQLGRLVHADGTIAVACAEALGRLGEQEGLPFLQRVDRTASHMLRIPALDARGKLQDPTLVDALGPAFAKDHMNIRLALLRAVGRLDHKKVDGLLAKLDTGIKDAAVKRVLDLVRLSRGDAAVVKRFEEPLEKAGPEVPLARQVLSIPHSVVEPLVLLIAGNGDDAFKGLRERAYRQLGDRRMKGAAVLELLNDYLATDVKGHHRLHAAASLLQLGAPKARARVRKELKDLKVIKRVDVQTGAGKARRYAGSHLSDVAARWAVGKTWGAMPLLSRWLNPPKKKAKKPAPKAAPKEDPQKPAEGTRTRQPPKGGLLAPRPPAKVPKFFRHAFARRDAVEALGELVWAARQVAQDKADAAWPRAPKKLEAWAATGVRALERSLHDSHLLVRRAATRTLARLGGHVLQPGASLKEERAALEAALRALDAK